MGCGVDSQPNLEENSIDTQEVITQKEEQYYILEELPLPNPDIALKALVGENEKYAVEDPILHGEKVYRYTIVYDVEGNWKDAYVQILNLADMQWENILCTEEFELEGKKYSGFQEPFFSENNDAYSYVYSAEENTYYLGRLGESGIEEIICKVPESLMEDETHPGWRKELACDMSGNFYSFYESENSYTFLNGLLQAQKEKTLSGEILGIVQGATEMPVYWYGVDTEGNATIQSVEGSEVLLKDFDKVQVYDYIAEFSTTGSLFLADSQAIWLVDEEPKKVFDFIKRDYVINDLYSMDTGTEGEMHLLVKLDGSYTLLTLKETDTPQDETKQEIVLAFTARHLAMERIIARFNRQSNKYHVSVLLPEANEDVMTFQERIQLEISTGKGPDILGHDVALSFTPYVENGYLECLDGILVDESQYLSAALEGCRIDGKLYGIPYDCTLRFVAYSGAYSKGRDSWTVEELMDAVQSSDVKILQGDFGGIDIVKNYALYDNADTTYIDWENGVSYLTEEPFMKLLSFAKTYADTGKLQGERGALAARGDAFALAVEMDALHWLNYVNATFEGESAIIGYPRSEGNGIYVNCRELYVNSSSDCKEGAKEFLRYLLSENEQEKYIEFDIMELMNGVGSVYGYSCNFPVHMGAYEELLENAQMDSTESEYRNYGVTYDYVPYTEKEVEQFYFLLEHAQPYKPYALAISRIISEELQPYFEGDVTAELAAEKLDNRVQLYLDERK